MRPETPVSLRVRAVHGRTRAQGYSGDADWSVIAAVAVKLLIAPLLVYALARAGFPELRPAQAGAVLETAMPTMLMAASFADRFHLDVRAAALTASWTSLVFLLTLPGEVMKRFMGNNILATVLLAAGILLAIATLITGYQRKVMATMWLTGPLVYVMAFMRDSVRSGYLAPYFDMNKVPANVQWSPLIFFLLTLVLGIAVVVWMLFRLALIKKTSQNKT